MRKKRSSEVLLKALEAIRDRIEEEDPELHSKCEQECFHLADKAIVEHKSLKCKPLHVRIRERVNLS